jgi:hypothetical protein
MTSRGIVPMTEVSLFRLHLLRAAYLLVAGGIALTMWPVIVSHDPALPLMNGVVVSMLGAVSLLAALGLKYPLALLPVLLFELLWKAVWLIGFALPLWSAGRIDARTAETVRDCLLGLVLVPIIPWSHVVAHYLRRPGERWRAGPAAAPGATAAARP